MANRRSLFLSFFLLGAAFFLFLFSLCFSFPGRDFLYKYGVKIHEYTLGYLLHFTSLTATCLYIYMNKDTKSSFRFLIGVFFLMINIGALLFIILLDYIGSGMKFG
jgi:hypothetical protein